MDSIKVKAIVLGSQDLKEKDKLVYLYTLENGLMTASLKSVKTEKAKLKYAKEIFCFGDFIISLPSKIITSVDVEDTFFDITKDIDKYYVSCAILDIVKTISPSEIANPSLFVETLKAIGCIAYDNVKSKYVLIKFLLSVFSSMGYQLSSKKCSVCGQDFYNKRFLNLEFGEVVCIGCKASNSIAISPKCASCFKILDITPYDSLPTIHLAEGSEDEAINVLIRNFEKRFSKKLNLI